MLRRSICIIIMGCEGPAYINSQVKTLRCHCRCHRHHGRGHCVVIASWSTVVMLWPPPLLLPPSLSCRHCCCHHCHHGHGHHIVVASWLWLDPGWDSCESVGKEARGRERGELRREVINERKKLFVRTQVHTWTRDSTAQQDCK